MRSPLILLVSGALCATPVHAQLVSNGANWGVSLGLDAFTAQFDPSGPHHPRGDVEYAFPTRGWGLRINGGAVFLKHYLMGGDVGVAFMGGEHTYPPTNASDGYRVVTTNAIVSSMYVGWITTPMGSTPKMGRKWWAGALLGREQWSGERQIISCSTCIIDPMKEKSGVYVEPFVVFGGGDKNGGGGFRAAYRYPVLQAPTIRGQASLGFYFNFLTL